MRVIDIILEANGGLWDRMQERRSGKPMTFEKDGETLDLLDVEVFPQDPKFSSYKEMVLDQEQPVSSTPLGQAEKNVPVWTGRQKQQPVAVPLAEPEPEEVEPEPEEVEPEPEELVEAKGTAHTQLMIDDVSSWIQSKAASIEYMPTPTAGNGAAMVVILGNSEKKIAFVHWTSSKKKDKIPAIFWQTSKFERTTGWLQSDKGKSAVSKAAVLKIEPSDLLYAGQKYRIENIPNLIKTGRLQDRTDIPPELKDGIPELLEDLLSGSSPKPVIDLNQYERQIEVVLGETAAPIALMTGHRVSDAYNDVTEHLLEPMGLTWGDFTEVVYGAKGGMVEDCNIYAGDTKLMVSSKDSTGGASASLTGFAETLYKRPEEFGPGTKFYKKYQDLFLVLEALFRHSAVDGVIIASIHLDLITAEEAKYIKSILGTGRGSIEETNLFPNLPKVLKAKGIKGEMRTNAKGQQVVSKQGVDTNNFKYQMGYHLLGNLAKMIQHHFANDQDRVTAMFKTVLNRADMVQVYTKVQKNNQGIWFADFAVTWPPTFKGKIKVDADHYSAQAAPSKKISFRFD
jgi:hypothetical protein